MKLDINRINGNEIIDHLNHLTKNEEVFEDTNICSNSFTFESQKIDKDTYKLYFLLDYNNWGTDQEIDGNEIHISQTGVSCRVGEPFEGDGTAETIEVAVVDWLKDHAFRDSPEEDFQEIMREVYQTLPEIAFNDPRGMEEQINKLTRAKSFMK